MQPAICQGLNFCFNLYSVDRFGSDIGTCKCSKGEIHTEGFRGAEQLSLLPITSALAGVSHQIPPRRIAIVAPLLL